MIRSVHPVRGGVQRGVQGRNPRRYCVVQGVQGQPQRGRARAKTIRCANMSATHDARPRTPLHTPHALHNAGVVRVSRVQGGVQGRMHPAHARARLRANPLSPFPESEGRGAQL